MDLKELIVNCKRCGHQWLRRNKTSTPVACPGCHSTLWDTDRVRNRAEQFLAKQHEQKSSDTVHVNRGVSKHSKGATKGKTILRKVAATRSRKGTN